MGLESPSGKVVKVNLADTLHTETFYIRFLISTKTSGTFFKYLCYIIHISSKSSGFAFWFAKSMKTLNKTWFTPVFSTLMQNRTEGLAIVGAGALLVGLHLAGLPGWACPFKSLFGVPCPGCGLTTATGQLLRGQFVDSLHTHAFAPIFVFSFFVMTVVLLLPEKQRESAIVRIAKFEQRTGMTSLVLVSLLIYWVIRLAGLV